jgi:hypothetical protein
VILSSIPFNIILTAAKLQCCFHMTQIWFLPRSSNRFWSCKPVPNVNYGTVSENFWSWFQVAKIKKDVAKSPKKYFQLQCFLMVGRSHWNKKKTKNWPKIMKPDGKGRGGRIRAWHIHYAYCIEPWFTILVHGL